MDFFTVIYNWTLETAPVTIGKNVSKNATIQTDDELLQDVQPNCTELSRLHGPDGSVCSKVGKILVIQNFDEA